MRGSYRGFPTKKNVLNVFDGTAKKGNGTFPKGRDLPDTSVTNTISNIAAKFRHLDDFLDHDADILKRWI